MNVMLDKNLDPQHMLTVDKRSFRVNLVFLTDGNHCNEFMASEDLEYPQGRKDRCIGIDMQLMVVLINSRMEAMSTLGA